MSAASAAHGDTRDADILAAFSPGARRAANSSDAAVVSAGGDTRDADILAAFSPGARGAARIGVLLLMLGGWRWFVVCLAAPDH